MSMRTYASSRVKRKSFYILLFSRSGGHKTKENYPTRPGSPTPCKQGLSYTFYGGNVALVLVHFFSLPLIFTLPWWPLAFLILLPPLQNFHVVLSTKKCLLCFKFLAPDLCRPCSRWASLACRLLSLFLGLSLALHSKLWTGQLI